MKNLDKIVFLNEYNDFVFLRQYTINIKRIGRIYLDNKRLYHVDLFTKNYSFNKFNNKYKYKIKYRAVLVAENALKEYGYEIISKGEAEKLRLLL